MRFILAALLLLTIGCRTSNYVQIVGGEDKSQVTGDNNELRVTPGACVFYGELLTIEGTGAIFMVKSLVGCGPGVTRYPKVGTKLSARFRGELNAEVGQSVQVKVMEFEKSFSVLEIIPL
ncbi:hypothetical protein KMW28_03995 [Flammeovirga yaeyamensis]|uniref:Lipoprotein n=1 Tax=Flammeovirga yaeyamensis TaxID=367791 RepID=A0AAX1N6A0_9BACT|nr:hypothetical protein [Flammeovirga yaeyamensis]MBB3697317.1 hypothetical protein [Flammeovirga yaeyamensis]NMF36011.1 hypothetical protein [Flammeovirga yaeyamensis]QWG02747.1 hypothetical protein KMW28_03995 [Flammeovirga yaeyamensis]